MSGMSSPSIRPNVGPDIALEDLGAGYGPHGARAPTEDCSTGPCLGLDDRYDPINPPPDFPKIDFLPLVLRCWTLTIALAFFAACLAGLIVLVVLDYRQPDKLHGRQVTYQKIIPLVPSTVGAITSVWWASIYWTYIRIVPYQAMASESFRCLWNPQKVERVNKKALNRRGMGFTCYRVQTLCVITQGLVLLSLNAAKAALIQVRPTSGGWAIVPSHFLAYSCMLIYFMILFSIVVMMISFSRKPSGLRWDPGSLASQISLLTLFDSNGILEGLEFGQWRNTEPLYERNGFSKDLTSRGVFRLGYWKHAKSGYIVYGTRMLLRDVDVDSSNVPPGPLQSVKLQAARPFTVKSQHAFHESTLSSEENDENHEVRRRYPNLVPYYSDDEAPLDDAGRIVHEPEVAAFGRAIWPLRDPSILFFTLAGTALLITWVIAMFRYDLRNPMELSAMPVGWQNRGKGRQTFIVFFLVFFLSLFQLIFTPAARYYSRMEPLRGLKESQPATLSVLLDYVSPNAATTIVRALSNCHWRVAWFVFLSIFAQTAPIIARGIVRQSKETTTDGAVTFIIDPLNFYLTFSITVIYCLSLPFARLPAPYGAPHYLTTALDLYPYIYHSNLAQHPEFVTRHPFDDETHVKAQVLLARQQYHFGLYLCEGGRRHIGIATSALPVDKVVVKHGWLHFNYRFFHRPFIQHFIGREHIPLAHQHDAGSVPKPADERSVDHDPALVISTGVANANVDAQDAPGSATLTHRSTWTEEQDERTDDARYMPLRNLRCGTGPQR